MAWWRVTTQWGTSGKSITFEDTMMVEASSYEEANRIAQLRLNFYEKIIKIERVA